MDVVIYARFSSTAQREESIEGQIKVCTKFAEQNDYTVIDAYCDRAISGKIDERPAFQKLLTDSARKKFQAVIVYSIDRFGRNLEQSVLNEHRLNKNGVALISATENFAENPAGRLQRNIMMSFAQYYSDELSQKVQRGMEINAEKGLTTGGAVAMGYMLDSNKRYQVNPDTAPVVQYVFESYANGATVKEIVAHLNSQGFKTALGKPFQKNSLNAMLRNKRYIGIYTYRGKERPCGIPRIISDELFNKVAAILDKNKHTPASSKAKEDYLLTTKLFCGHCKEMMVGVSGTGKMNKTYRYYSCNGARRRKCKMKNVKKEYIEDLVIMQCRAQLTEKNIDRIASSVIEMSDAQKDDSAIRFLKKKLEENQRKYENSIAAVMECGIESIRKTFYEKIAELEEEQKALKQQILIEEEPIPNLTASEIKFFLLSLKNGDIDDLKYRRTLISVFINRIYLYDGIMTIIFNSGGKPVTITDILMSEIDESVAQAKSSYLARQGASEKKHVGRLPACFFVICKWSSSTSD